MTIIIVINIRVNELVILEVVSVHMQKIKKVEVRSKANQNCHIICSKKFKLKKALSS